MKIMANHAHVFQKHVREVGSFDNLKAVMDSCGISKVVAFAPFADFYDNSCTNHNVWLAEQIKSDDRFWGFGTVDFSADNLKDQVCEIAQLGLSGIKMHPAHQKFKIDCERAFEVYEEAEKQKLVVSFHSGVHWHRISDYNMLLFDEVAYSFKNLKFSMEHLGGYSFFKEGIAIMINNPKTTYAGLTSVFDSDKNRFWYLNASQIADLLWITGPERSIFGLDFPYNGIEDTKASIEKIKSLDVTEDDKSNILGGNLLKFLSTED